MLAQVECFFEEFPITPEFRERTFEGKLLAGQAGTHSIHNPLFSNLSIARRRFDKEPVVVVMCGEPALCQSIQAPFQDTEYGFKRYRWNEFGNFCHGKNNPVV